jgi:hypothetical protein
VNTSSGYQVVIAALIGAAISLLTTWLNNWFQLKREQKQWHRNQLNQIYTNCITLLNQIDNEIWVEKIDRDKLIKILEDFNLSLENNFPKVATKLNTDYAIVPDEKVKLFQRYYIELQERLILLLASQPRKCIELSEADNFIDLSWESPCKFSDELGHIKMSDGSYTAREHITPPIIKSFPQNEKDAILTMTFIRFPSKATVKSLKAQVVNLMVSDPRIKDIS